MRRSFARLISFLEEKNSFLLYLCIFLILCGGLYYSFELGSKLRYTDEEEYYMIAQNMAHSFTYSLDGINPTAYRPPGYPVILYICDIVGLGIQATRFVDFLFLSGSLFFLNLLLKKNVNSSVASLAVILSFCYPLFFYTAGTLYPQTFGSFLFLMILYILFSKKKLSVPQLGLTGVLCGYLVLTIPTFLSVIFVILFILLFNRLNIKSIVIIIVSGFIVLSVWAIRNYAAFDSAIFTSTNSGINLLLGNSKNTTPNSGVNVDISEYEKMIHQLNEVQQDSFYRSQAIQFISNNPSKAFSLYFMKLLNYFNYRNDLATTTESSLWRDMIMLCTYGPLLLIFILRLCLLKKISLIDIEKYLIVIYLINALFQAIFFTRIRFRIPFDFLLISVVAIFLLEILRRLSVPKNV